MKTFLFSYKGFLLALLVISSLGFAAARYDIYRLRPSPQTGQIIGEKNGFWSAITQTEFFLSIFGWSSSEGDYGVPALTYDEDTNVQSLINIRPWTKSASRDGTSLTFDSKGQTTQINWVIQTWDNVDNLYRWALAKTYNDTTGIVLTAVNLNSTGYKILATRGDTLLKNATVSVGYRINEFTEFYPY
jgi:hypothetical protein